MKQYITKRIQSFGHAWDGIKWLFCNETHAKIHLTAAFIVIAMGLIFHISTMEWCAISFAIGGVFMAEGFNTSIEKVCDKVSPERNPYIKIAKDVAAGAVLLFVLSAVAVGLIVFLPKIFC